MNRMLRLLVPLLLLAGGCSTVPDIIVPAGDGTYGNDVSFMKKHVEVIELTDSRGQARVAVVPAYQGRVMTSSAAGDAGMSFGWINRKHIASGKFVPHINVFGGEDRFWLGPEGGQFAIFFPPDSPFDLTNWQTPPIIDTEPYDLVSSTSTRAFFRKRGTIFNRSGGGFDVLIERTIRLLNPIRAEQLLGTEIPTSVRMVAYESNNRLTNDGDNAWNKSTGLLSIWILGMYNPSPETTVVIPFVAGGEEKLGPRVNDEYFGKVPAERLVVRDDVLFFSGDGQYRSKIGITPQRAKSTIGSYDAAAGVLTLVHYNRPDDATDYVNSMWELQKKPYGGDAINSYNDGPPEPGKAPLGPFYELETSSPAVELSPRGSVTHNHATFHFQGNDVDLDAIAQATLGVGLAEIASVFAPPEPELSDIPPELDMAPVEEATPGDTTGETP